MNHDYCHCVDYDADLCPQDCFRGQLVKDYNERQKDFIGIPLSWSHLRVTDLCPLYKPKRTHGDEIRAMTDEELCNAACKHGYCAHAEDEKIICNEYGCKNCWLDWLKQEIDNG